MTMRDAPTFGDLVRRYRRDAGMTADELAAAVGLQWREMNELERGEGAAPDADLVARLANALKLSAPDRAALEVAASHLHAAQPAPAAPSTSSDEAPSPRPLCQQLPTGGYLGALPDGPLAGREAEVERLRTLVQEVAGGQGRLVLLAGEPGIGKTRLAQEVTREAYERGFLIAAGRCYEPQQSVPYFPFLEALTRVYAAAPATLRAELPHRWAEVTRLLPDQSVGVPVTSSAREGTREDQQRLFWQVSGFFQALLAVQPVAVLLDDLHWADTASLDLLQHLARQTHDQRILLLGTYRDVELNRQHPLEAALRDLGREKLVERVTVKRLSVEGTRALIGVTMREGRISEEFARLLHERTEGNPFFTQEVLRALVDRGDLFQRDGQWDRKALDDIEVPESIRSVIGQRLAHLSAETQEALREASVLGQTFDFDLLAALSGRDEDALERLLTEASGSGLVHEASADHYGFHHALIQQALYQELPTRKRRRLHRAAGEALEKLSVAKSEGRAAELAYHFLQADEGARALPYALQAGDQAEAVYAHAEAERNYRTALELADAVEDTAREAVALEKLGRELGHLGRDGEAIETLDRAASAHAATGDTEGELRALAGSLSIRTGHGMAASEEGLARVRPLLQAFDVRPEEVASPGLAEVYLSVAAVYGARERWEEAMAAAVRAERLARALLDDTLLAKALSWRAGGIANRGNREEALALFETIICLTERMGDVPSLLGALSQMAYSLEMMGEFARTEPYVQRLVEVAETCGELRPLWLAYGCVGWHAFLVGDWPRARVQYQRCVAIAERIDAFGLSWTSADMPRSLGELDLAEGREREAAEELERGLALAQQFDDLWGQRLVQLPLAEQDLLAGRADAAHSRLVPLLDQESGKEEADVALLLPLLAWAELEMGLEDHAATTLGHGVRRATRQAPRALVDTLRVRALLAIKRGDWQTAHDALDQTLSRTRAMPYPYAEAKALYIYGQLHAAKGEPQQAREKYRAALAICDRLGEGLYRPHIERALAELPATST